VDEQSRRRAKVGRTTSSPVESDPQAFAALVGEAIRATRQERGWTQVELAQAARLSPNYIARLERGELGPSLFVAQQIAEALEINVEALVRPQTRSARSGRRMAAR
jgi:transcriptional regulator with XRE-family HTH domain